MSQVVLTVVRIRDGVGIHRLSLSIRQTVQVVLALTGAAGPSKWPCVNPTLSDLVSFWVPRVPIIWGHALKKFIALVLVKC